MKLKVAKMETCVVCDLQTTKYKCPKCFLRYCSVSCCKAHKESCQQVPAALKREPPKAPQSSVDPPIRPLWTGGNNESLFQVTEEDEDAVPEELLNRLRDDEDLRSDLRNPHLRAIMENMVNFDNPSEHMTRAMQEPIFCEFADKCLKVVDSSNPQMEFGELGV